MAQQTGPFPRLTVTLHRQRFRFRLRHHPADVDMSSLLVSDIATCSARAMLPENAKSCGCVASACPPASRATKHPSSTARFTPRFYFPEGRLAVSVSERPPLALSYIVETPSGNRFRWAIDEPNAENVPSDVSFTDIIGGAEIGGYDQFEATLPRKPGTDYQDLERLSTIYVRGAGGSSKVGEYRLEATPRTSGTERSITVQGNGWKAHAEDNKSAQEIYVDRDISHWTEPSMQRQANRRAAGDKYQGSVEITPDATTGVPGIVMSLDRVTPVSILVEYWYNGLGCSLSSVYYDVLNYDNGTLNNMAAVSWTVEVFMNQDDLGTGGSGTGDLLPNPDNGYHSPAGSSWKFASYEWRWPATAATADGDWAVHWRRPAVWGTHGLTKRGTAPSDGVYASDVIANAFSRWAPLLNFTTGSTGTLKPTSFVIPQAEYRDPTTAGAIARDVNRFHLRDLAVWDDRTVYYNERGERGRSWRARVGPAKLEETGPQVDRLWNGVIVKFQDVDGTTKTVGPTGSTASSTSTDLTDTDPENPANKLGIRRWAILEMNIVSTTAAATEVGRRFLIETKALDSSGKATLVGHVQDDKGIWWPYWMVKSGDRIVFTDASDKSERRIIRSEKNPSDRSCSIEIDAPSNGLEALLERLGVVLVELGLN